MKKRWLHFSSHLKKLLDRSVGVEYRQGSQELDVLALGGRALGTNRKENLLFPSSYR